MASTRDELRAFLDSQGVKYPPSAGSTDLYRLVLANNLVAAYEAYQAEQADIAEEAEATANFEEQTRLLFPWMPANLVKIYAEAWAETGDHNLALGTLRDSAEYEAFFVGIKREDDSLRMTEQEWFSTREAYTRLFSDFGLNPTLFQDRYVELMEGDVSPSELAARLGGAYEQIITNIPQVREFYANNFGVQMTDQAIFASFIDPDIGEGILQHRISVAQVGGQGLAHGFDVDLNFATSLADFGLSQQGAGEFFTSAEAQLPILETLALRHHDPDDTFDLGEFADAAIFGDSEEARRIRRLLDAEAASFTDQLGTVATGEDLAVTGLRPR